MCILIHGVSMQVCDASTIDVRHQGFTVAGDAIFDVAVGGMGVQVIRLTLPTACGAAGREEDNLNVMSGSSDLDRRDR